MKPNKLIARIRRADVSNVSFDDLLRLVEVLGFREVGGKGSHRVFTRPGVAELINLQTVRGDAKPYQVRQVADLIRRYKLSMGGEEEK
jgi:predicted RNA binding protein YcfA (HicA-like mRNA interferase family)